VHYIIVISAGKSSKLCTGESGDPTRRKEAAGGSQDRNKNKNRKNRS
jgi:hypothetical protein